MVRRMGQPTTRPFSEDTDEVISRRVRARVLLKAALTPVVVGYFAVLALLALIVAGAQGPRLSVPGLLAASGPAWLGAYQVPLRIGGEPLGVLPLVPTVAVGLLVARCAGAASRRVGAVSPSHAALVVVATVVAHVLATVPIVLFTNGSGGLAAEPVAAFVMPALIAGFCATVGLSRRGGIIAALRTHLDPGARRGLRAGLLGLAALLTGGALALTLATALSTATASRLFAVNAPDAGSGLGMLLLCLGYIPNAVVMAAGFTIGPGFSVGLLSASPFTYSGGVVPALPLLAGMPERQALWWPALLLLPAAAGALVGWSLRHADRRPTARLRMVGVAGASAAFGTVVLGALAGGRLAEGAFDPVSLPLGLVSIAAFCWIAIPGGLVSWFAGPRVRRAKPVAAPSAGEQDRADEAESAAELASGSDEPEEQGETAGQDWGGAEGESGEETNGSVEKAERDGTEADGGSGEEESGEGEAGEETNEPDENGDPDVTRADDSGDEGGDNEGGASGGSEGARDADEEQAGGETDVGRA